MRLKLPFGFMSLIAVYAPTDVCKLGMEEMFYTKLASVSDRCLQRDIHIVLGDFNEVFGCDRAGYEMSHPDPYRWTWYRNVGNATKEIDYILVSTRWRILQNCRVYRSAEFCGTDHRLVVATLQVHFKTPQRSNEYPRVLHLDRRRERECAQGIC
ncbi:craniofacial development protein 2-like [Penaeus vannamei]|uniref:craniofacial development protein 2-like n=1 Tax=Penaeus vannamei TaxID=6689 RepID=UPI00387F50E9